MTRVGGKTDLLNRGTGLEMDDDDARAPAPKRFKPDANGTSSSSGATIGTLKTLVTQITTDPRLRKEELKAWAATIVDALETRELNEYCMYIKQSLEAKKEANKRKAAAAPQAPVSKAAGLAPQQSAASNASSSVVKDGKQAKLASVLPAKSEDSEDGEVKPGMTATFNPLDHMGESDEAAKGPVQVIPKGPERKAKPKRTPEEEEQFTELIHSINDNGIFKDDELLPDRFNEVITDQIRLCRKLKDWWSIWSNCAIRGNENTVA